MLADEGYALTVTARRPEKLEAAADELRALGAEVVHVAGNVANEEDIVAAVERHREPFGRLDVLVNNAGLGVGGSIDELQTKHLDMQLAVNLRSMILFYRESMEMLRAAGAGDGGAGGEHGVDHRQDRHAGPRPSTPPPSTGWSASRRR